MLENDTRRRLPPRLAVQLLLALCAASAAAQSPAAIRYTVDVSSPETQRAIVTAVVPASGQPAVELLLPVWSPGYYVREDYATRIERLTATSPAGDTLAVLQPQPNRWRITTAGAANITVTYTVRCTEQFVTRNWVGPDLAVLNGAPTFITLADGIVRPHDVAFVLPPGWPRSVTALAPAPDGQPHHYRAASYDELVDSPVVLGNVQLHEFEVGGSRHVLADAGAVPAAWDGALAAANLERIVRATGRFWGFLPYDRYVFLNIFRRGGGGLEHAASTLLTAGTGMSGGGDVRWLAYVAHEYFHALNVKRLRPVELGPFDYEQPPATSGLWISEGLTSYYGDLLTRRAGLTTDEQYLATLSGAIRSLQGSPGRLVQTLEQASLGIFATGGSGVGGDRNTTVSYYTKGQVVGWLLDARIRRATSGAKSLDDVMRLAYQRYSDARGFTRAQFEATAAEVAGTDLAEFFRRAIRSTEELEYDVALDWYGLHFTEAGEPLRPWTLELRPDATAEQRAHWRQLTAGEA
ncbi:MAG: M61 family metallopeptidase [Gemmatimonadetes bacterium]|nr:M61 family metallopeptidase [Gemmatimonadota bacterium]